MPEMTFSSGDIRALATKLDKVTADFDDRERALLVAIIGLARGALDTEAQDQVRGFASGQRGPEGVIVTKPTASIPTVGGALTSFSSGSEDPVESVSFNFGSIKWVYKKQN